MLYELFNTEDISDTSGARKTGDLVLPFMEVENLPLTASSPRLVDWSADSLSVKYLKLPSCYGL